MEKKNLPVQTNKRSNPLWEEIKRFSKQKYSLAIILVLVGVLGIIIPVIPGLLLILLAVALFKKGLMAKIMAKINSLF